MKTSTKRSVKLYSGLTAKQLAILTFEAAAEQNADEIDKIRSAVPWRNYRAIDADYTDFRDAWQNVAMLWAGECWRQLFLFSTSVGSDETQNHRARLTALAKVMRDLCTMHGADYGAVLKFTGVADLQDMSAAADEALYAKWISDLSECLPGSATH